MAVPAGSSRHPAGPGRPIWWSSRAAAVRALWTARRSTHHLHHLVGAFAMVYMAAAMTASPGHHMHGGHGGLAPLTGVLLLYFAGYVLWSGVRLVPVTTVTAAAVRGPSAGETGRSWRAYAGCPWPSPWWRCSSRSDPRRGRRRSCRTAPSCSVAGTAAGAPAALRQTVACVTLPRRYVSRRDTRLIGFGP
ncbi:DUF5134 domain-containing protein [Streptomyces sp. T1317-0309]|nr:DUF5134 domain-containing protein [Streptomyces sp. T1317-0309]